MHNYLPFGENAIAREFLLQGPERQQFCLGRAGGIRLLGSGYKCSIYKVVNDAGLDTRRFLLLVAGTSFVFATLNLSFSLAKRLRG